MQQKIFNFRINIYLLIIVAVVLLIFLHNLGILKPAENLVIFLMKPIEKVVYHTGLKIFNSDNYLTKENLEKENKELEDKLNKALIENARLHSLIMKNEILQKESAFLEAHNFQAKTAHIIAKMPTTSQIFLLDKGKKDHIQIGLPIIYGEGILVGKIIETEDLTSKMLLINDSNSTVAAQVQNETNSPGVVVGKLGLSLEMQLIPQAEEIALDQTVVTSGLEENIPQGLVIGQISEIDKKTEELFQTASIEPLASLDRLSVVSIIIP